MNWNKLLFREDWKPRSLVRLVVFRRNKTPRRGFLRVVYKKNGMMRSVFAPWLTRAVAPAPPSQAAPEDVLPEIKVLSQLQHLADQAEGWKRAGKLVSPMRAEDVLQHLERVRGQWALLSVSHDNYKQVPGGVQVCLMREQELVTKSGGHFLNIHPVQPLPCLASPDETDTAVMLLIDGEAAGACLMSDLIAAIGTLAQADTLTKFSLTIHHLLGHNPEQIAQLGAHIASEDTVLWLHDYFTICPGYKLLRNDLAYCGAPDVTSNACGLCAYGKERVRHLPRIQHLLERLSPTVLAPSEFTRDLWQARAGLTAAKTLAVPHLTLNWQARCKTRTEKAASRIRIGFLGTPARHKGWPVFEDLAHNSALSDKFEFVSFFKSKRKSKIRNLPIQLTPEQPNAMAEAVAAEKIDLVLHWPQWPETFALTAYEAYQGGASLITNTVSGNVAATVETMGRGVVLQDVDELLRFLTSDAVNSLVAQVRAERAAFEVSASSSRLSLSVLEGKA